MTKLKPKARKNKPAREADACHTLQTRLGFAVSGSDVDDILSKQAEHYGKLERKLCANWAKICKSGLKPVTSIKTDFSKQHSILARQFNSIATTLSGKIESIRELQKEYLVNAELKLEAIKEKVKVVEEEERIKNGPIGKLWSKKKLAKFGSDWKKYHEALTRAENKVKKWTDAVQSIGLPSIAFGGNAFYRKQFNLEQNNLTFKEWLKLWQDKRSSQIFYLGSHDETQGNSNCQIKLNSDGKSFNLKIKLYDSVAKSFPNNHNIDKNGNLILPKIFFPYEEAFLRSVATKPQALQEAISFRFLKDEQGWRLLASMDKPSVPIITHDKKFGCIGIDFNADNLTVTETDQNGNFIKPKLSKINITINVKQKEQQKFLSIGYVDGFKIPLDFSKCHTSDQREALISDALQLVVEYAVKVQKPICVENLDFAAKKKKMALDTGTTKFHKQKNRGLSSLMYSKYLSLLRSKTRFQGIELILVNPAYTSVIGAVKYAKQNGVSTHISAAGVISRRGQGFKETMPKQAEAEIPYKGKLWSCPLPVRNKNTATKVQGSNTPNFQASKKPRKKKNPWSSVGVALRKTLSKARAAHKAALSP